MFRCVICKDDDESSNLIQLRWKGSQGINKASKERCDTLETHAGEFVHEDCRRRYTNKLIIKSDLRMNIEEPLRSETPTLRSKSQFSFSEHCLFCGVTAKQDKRKGIEVFPVRTDDFKSKILKACDERNDKWAGDVRGRIEFVSDLHAADALYHQSCSVNFRTGKTLPLLFSPSSKKAQKRGRPVSQHESFQQIVDYLRNHEDEQITVSDLVNKMSEISGENAYSTVYMKKKLREHFGNEIMITDISGKKSVVTLRDTATSVLQDFYNRPKFQDPESEKRSIIKAAAKLIKSDIRSLPVNKENYPTPQDISSLNKNFEYIPGCLLLLLQDIFAEKDSRLKISSVGQAIIQAARPRAVITPLQLGLGVQLHHCFASRFLVETLYNLGFCSSYSEVQKFENSAAISQGINIPGYSDDSFVQFVADNVDHDIRTLDGYGTFHGMGIIAGITPETKRTQPIPRLDVVQKELIPIAKIEIKYYRSPSNLFSELCYEELEDLKVVDTTKFLDFLSVVTWPLKAPVPGWSGVMQMVHEGEHPGKSGIVFLPMIDMNASDVSCIYSTMTFICSQARHYKVTPVLTFDQPLYWKAYTIIANEPQGSALKSVVLRLGPFHMEMSFLGCIGHVMKGFGLQEVLEIIYAPNAVTHMLSGKAVARATRGHMLVNVALHSLLVSKIFNVDIETKPAEENINDTEIYVEEKSDDDDHDDHDDDDENDDHDDNNDDVDEVANKENRKQALINSTELYDRLLYGELSVEEVCEDPIVAETYTIFEKQMTAFENNRTARLWIQYSQMLEILRTFIKAERTGNWDLHLQSVYNMLPYFAAAGHNLYAKSAYVYLMTMHHLPAEHPEIFAAFQGGHHVLRRSDRYWAGLSTDLTIEQVLMRSIKTSGGMTRGRGMGENQRAQWIMSMPACADINEAMQELTGTGFQTSDMHKETTHSRKERDQKDILSVMNFFKSHNPFDDDNTLRNIQTGEIADATVNADNAKDVGNKILASMKNQNIVDYTFKKSLQVVTQASKSKIKVDGETVDVDPQLLFQRCTSAANGLFEDPSEIFRFELCSVPSALFENNGLPREAHKSTLAAALWNTVDCAASDNDIDDAVYILDGGSLLHRIPWTRGESFKSICKVYIDYITRLYPTGSTVVVFDGYSQQPSTKDITHIRRNLSIRNSPDIHFTEDMLFSSKKDIFLSNPNNKQRFIKLLGKRLEETDVKVHHAESDADVMIVQTAITQSATNEVVVIGEDTDLLILLLYHADPEKHNVYLKSEQKQTSVKKVKIWDILKAKSNLGGKTCTLLPAIHAFSGCDTTSRMFGIGKGIVLKKLRSEPEFQDMTTTFMTSTDSRIIAASGEEMMVSLYGGLRYEGLDLLRYRKFASKVVVGNIYVQVKSLPPTSDSARFHCLRSYLQCRTWIGNADDLSPTDWGWHIDDNKLLPVKGTLPPAPEKLLKIIKCNCKINCDTMRCSCRKHGIECSSACGECRGVSCLNSSAPTLNDVQESE